MLRLSHPYPPRCSLANFANIVKIYLNGNHTGLPLKNFLSIGIPDAASFQAVMQNLKKIDEKILFPLFHCQNFDLPWIKWKSHHEFTFRKHDKSV